MKAKETVKIRSKSPTPPKQTQNNQNKHNLLLIYACILSVFVSELAISLYLYSYINNLSDAKHTFTRSEIEVIVKDNIRSQSFKHEISELIKKSIDAVENDVHLTTEESVNNVNQVRNRRKRGALVLEDNMVTQGGVDDGRHVEFFNPKLRKELEAKDEVEKAKTGAKGAAPGGDSWVWLTSYSRIPQNAIEGFCKATKEYCPPGLPGQKGDRGDYGLPGLPGLQGPRGEIGWPGNPGLDGRDGVPGEPGLDGIPGRSGADGIPGIDGLPGMNGLNGRDGFNGTNGKPGHTGPQGPPGPHGPRGLAGPRGRPGKSGINGTPGIPGINAWKLRINGTNELLIPPSIAGTGNPVVNKPIVIHEGENLRLRCAATGTPIPQVEWRRSDGQTIPIGSWRMSSVQGHTLNVTHINRAHMGDYQCIANNGVPPSANQTFRLEVHFPPLIKIRNQMVGASNGSTAVLECEVEAFPESIRYWERADGRLLEHSDKYRVETITKDYQSLMRLNITRINHMDYSLYHCISKNEMGITRGVFTIYEIDPRLVTPPPVKADNNGAAMTIYGEGPPPSVSLDDLCPPIPPCPECTEVVKDFKCKDSVSVSDLVENLVITQLGNTTYPGLSNRTLGCLLYAVGKPVYHRFTEQNYGSWMRDASPRNEITGERFWVTQENDNIQLFEYNNKTMFRRDKPSRVYRLDEHPFMGNSHVVYNGSFYYNERNRALIRRYDLGSERYGESFKVPYLVMNESNFLYTTEYNYLDFNVDDNGLWVIYGLQSNNNTIVVKLEPNTMTAQYIWNISINHHKVGEMFIVCGVLYAVDSVTERTTKIRLALDLYTNKLKPEVNLAFTNPFKRTTLVGYNHKNKELYTWDRGNQLTYPVRYHEIDNNSTSSDQKVEGMENVNAQMQTGYDIY